MSATLKVSYCIIFFQRRPTLVATVAADVLIHITIFNFRLIIKYRAVMTEES